MEPAEVTLITILAIVNLAAGFGCAVPIANLLRKVDGKSKGFLRYLAVLIGIYFLECVAFPAGMATQCFSVGLAFVWGIVFGLWLRSGTSPREALRIAFSLSIYSCLPTGSFCVVLPVMWLIGGGHILSSEEGTGFGIPDLPWPLDTILGFCAALMLGTIVMKTVITTGEVSLLIYLREKSLLPRRGIQQL